MDYTYTYPLGAVSDDMLNVLSVYPNPSNSHFNVVMDSRVNDIVRLRLSNTFGQTVKVIDMDIKKGYNHLDINAEDIPNRVYILNVENNVNEVI